MTNYEKYFGTPERVSLSRLVPIVIESVGPSSARFVEPTDPSCQGGIVVFFGGSEVESLPSTLAFLNWLQDECE